MHLINTYIFKKHYILIKSSNKMNDSKADNEYLKSQTIKYQTFT